MNIQVSSTNPEEITEKDIEGIHEVLQDMWADTVGEFFQCRVCSHMHAKKDFYKHLSESEYSKTVRSIMGDFEIRLSCQKCGGEGDFVYGHNARKAIRERVLNKRKTFLILVRDEKNQIVGFEDAYISDLDDIFYREFETHYRDIGVEEIRRRIIRTLGYNPSELIGLSDIGLLAPYRSFQNIYAVLHAMAGIMTSEYDEIPGFTEIDEANSLHKVSTTVGGISLGIGNDSELKNKITNVGSQYKSDLIVYHSMTATYRNSFSGSFRDFLRLRKAGLEA